jgi:chromosome segregation ATPase
MQPCTMQFFISEDLLAKQRQELLRHWDTLAFALGQTQAQCNEKETDLGSALKKLDELKARFAKGEAKKSKIDGANTIW